MIKGQQDFLEITEMVDYRNKEDWEDQSRMNLRAI